MRLVVQRSKSDVIATGLNNMMARINIDARSGYSHPILLNSSNDLIMNYGIEDNPSYNTAKYLLDIGYSLIASNKNIIKKLPSINIHEGNRVSYSSPFSKQQGRIGKLVADSTYSYKVIYTPLKEGQFALFPSFRGYFLFCVGSLPNIISSLYSSYYVAQPIDNFPKILNEIFGYEIELIDNQSFYMRSNFPIPKFITNNFFTMEEDFEGSQEIIRDLSGEILFTFYSIIPSEQQNIVVTITAEFNLFKVIVNSNNIVEEFIGLPDELSSLVEESNLIRLILNKELRVGEYRLFPIDI